ncbi:hypothetical protein GCM10027514_16640 [Azotobacter armeniacus]
MSFCESRIFLQADGQWSGWREARRADIPNGAHWHASSAGRKRLEAIPPRLIPDGHRSLSAILQTLPQLARRQGIIECR